MSDPLVPPKMKILARCTPTLGAVSIVWSNAVENLIYPLNYMRAVFNVRDVRGNEIAETRNQCVVRALALDNDSRECSHLMWIDDDVIVSRLAVCRLMEHDRDIASGVYFTKGECSQPLIFPGRCAGVTPFVPDQVFETWGHGMGLTLVKAEVYRRMAAELDLGKDKYGNPAWYHTHDMSDVKAVDGFVYTAGTEDLYFLHRASELGYRPLIDTSKWAFGWHYDLRTHRGYPAEQFDQWAAGKPVTWKKSDGTEVVWE